MNLEVKNQPKAGRQELCKRTQLQSDGKKRQPKVQRKERDVNSIGVTERARGSLYASAAGLCNLISPGQTLLIIFCSRKKSITFFPALEIDSNT